MRFLNGIGLFAVALAATFFSGAAAFAAPVDGGFGLQAPVTEVQADIIAFHNMLLAIISGIVLLVLILLVLVIVRFRKSKNP
ncbi:cytochrome c oxidase subunit II transmembrane domain-containing protein, partial [Parvibaculum sp.]|uniref:cytochrome c oxidase subunit II transmembrane domain-containing protein n=1 Tax=Parvibaculum sp. TaxID=2024848 RepID=UPI003C726DC1